MSKLHIVGTNIPIIMKAFRTTNHFAGTTDKDIYEDDCLRLFWNGSSGTPWFKIQAKVAGNFSFGSFLIKSAANQEYHAIVDPVVVDDEYFLNNTPVSVPATIFDIVQFNIFSANIHYKPDAGDSCTYNIIAKSASGFVSSSDDALGIIIQSFVGADIP